MAGVGPCFRVSWTKSDEVRLALANAARAMIARMIRASTRLPGRFWGKGRVSETKEGMRCSSLNSISSLGVHLAQHKNWAYPMEKPRRLNTPGR